MKAHRCLCTFTFHPECRVDHVGEIERAEATIESLIRLPSFIDGAYSEITQSEIDEFVAHMADADYIGACGVYDRVARRVANTDIDQLIRLSHPSPLPRDLAAGELLAKYECLYRPADSHSPEPIPLGTSAGRPIVPPAPADRQEVTGLPAAGSFSTDRRYAA